MTNQEFNRILYLMDDRIPGARNRVLEGVAAVASLFGNPARLKILFLLAQAPRSVESLASLTGESVANTSQHLRRLLGEGIVSVRKDKLRRVYRLSLEQVAPVLEDLFDLAELLSGDVAAAQEEIGQFNGRDRATRKRLFDQLAHGGATLIDVRDPYEALQSPVNGSLAIPLGQLEEAAKDFVLSTTYYLICRGRLCDEATKGVALLRSLGFEAYRLKEMPAVVQELLILTGDCHE